MNYFLWTIIAVALGCVKRFYYEGGTVPHRPERLAGDFGFTGIGLVTSYILLWVGVLPFVRKDIQNIKLWLLTTLSFISW